MMSRVSEYWEQYDKTKIVEESKAFIPLPEGSSDYTSWTNIIVQSVLYHGGGLSAAHTPVHIITPNYPAEPPAAPVAFDERTIETSLIVPEPLPAPISMKEQWKNKMIETDRRSALPAKKQPATRINSNHNKTKGVIPDSASPRLRNCSVRSNNDK